MKNNLMKQRFVLAHSLKRYSSSFQVMTSCDSVHSEEAERDATNAGLHITFPFYLFVQYSILGLGLPHSFNFPAFKDKPRCMFSRFLKIHFEDDD